MRRKWPLHTRMLIALVAGLGAGLAAHEFAAGAPWLAVLVTYVAQPIGKIFLRLLFMLVIPLLFSALVISVTGLGELKNLGRIGWKTLAYAVVVTTIAVLIGITLVNVLRPGAGLSAEARAKLTAGAADRAAVLAKASAPKTGIDLVTEIVPTNAVRAVADGDLLAVIFFSFFFGIGLALTPTDAARRLEEAVRGLYDVSMRLIGMVLKVAPLGVLALTFGLAADLGFEILLRLARYVGVVVLGLAIHQFVVYALAVRFLGGMSPRRFFRDVEEAMITAFSTASSSASLPTALRVAEENLHLPPQVSRFVLTLGSALNHHGSALFEGVTVLFLAQFYGVELSVGKQATVVAIAVLGGIGTAGVPAGSIPVIAMILGQVGVPVEGIGLILGVDRFLDMCRTTLNVTGDLAAAVVISRGEPSG